MSVRRAQAEAASPSLPTPSAQAVHAVIAAAQAADRAFAARFADGLRVAPPRAPAPTAVLTRPKRGCKDADAKEPKSVTVPKTLELAPKGAEPNERPKAFKLVVKRIPLTPETEGDGVASWPNVYLLDALARLDSAHVEDCGGASVSANMVPEAGKDKPQTVGPWGVRDCNVDGYFMQKLTSLGQGTMQPMVPDVQSALQAPSIFVDVTYAGPYPKTVIAMDKRSVRPAAPPRDGTPVDEQLEFRALAPYLNRPGCPSPEAALRMMCEEAGHVPEGSRYNDTEFGRDGKPKPASYTERVRPTTLEDFVDSVCIDVRMEGLAENEGGPDDPAHPQHAGVRAFYRKTTKKENKPSKEEPLRTQRVAKKNLHNAAPEYDRNSSEFARYSQHASINSSSFADELSRWTTWAVLDTVGAFPRGSLFVLHVPLKTAYERWPSLPLFKPSDATDDAWTLYTRLLRRHRFEADYANNMTLEPRAPFPWANFVADVAAHGLEALCPFDGDGELKLDEAFMPYHATSTRAGCQDYLYTTLVCASTREPDLKKGTSNETGFGMVLLKAVEKLANSLGMLRVVLSALPPVVGYYFNVHKYDPCSRIGLDLSYATWDFGYKKETMPKPNHKKILATHVAPGSRSVDIYYPRTVPADYFQVPKDNARLIALQQAKGLNEAFQVEKATPTKYVAFPCARFLMTDGRGFVLNPNMGATLSTFRDNVGATAVVDRGRQLYDDQCASVTQAKIVEDVNAVERAFADAEEAFYLANGRQSRSQALSAGTTPSVERERDEKAVPACAEHTDSNERVACLIRELLLSDGADLTVTNDPNPPLAYADALGYLARRAELRKGVSEAQQKAIKAITKERERVPEADPAHVPPELGYKL